MEELKAQTFWKIIQSTEEKQTGFHSRNANWIASCENKQTTQKRKRKFKRQVISMSSAKHMYFCELISAPKQ